MSTYNEIVKKFNKTQFSGSSPPEIFVGRYEYPNIYSGILSPIEKGDTEQFSSPETWFKKQASIKEILDFRKNLVYSRFKTQVKAVRHEDKFTSSLQQIAMASKSVSAEFLLHKAPKFDPIQDNSVPMIGNPAPLKDIKLEENPKIPQKVDYLVSDNKLKAQSAIQDLYKAQIQTSNISKILSAGLLGLKAQRKLVPTRWAITAVDDTLSKSMLNKIRLMPEINEFQVFSGKYVGNHYEILLMPDKFSFEVIEISHTMPGIWHDYENFYGRKNYASSVTGAYYVNRLALSEYLLKIKHQASCIFFREVTPEYYSPLGVGILRELSRSAFQQQPEKFQTLKQALDHIKSKIKIPFSQYQDKSVLLKEHGKQKRLSEWF